MTVTTSKGDKGLIRALNRRGTKTGKLHASEVHDGRQREPRACDGCGALLSKRTWKVGERVSLALLDGVAWTTCPACRQVDAQVGQGRIVLDGSFVAPNAAALRTRIRHVAAQAAHTQPERRLVAVTRRGETLEVLTTSQKLAHRIVRELQKAFKGRATYAWSDDGTLFARWHRDAR